MGNNIMKKEIPQTEAMRETPENVRQHGRD